MGRRWKLSDLPKGLRIQDQCDIAAPGLINRLESNSKRIGLAKIAKDIQNEVRNTASVFPSNVESPIIDDLLATERSARHNTPCHIHVHSKRKKLVDADGVSAKAAIDGLVLAGILRDDNPECVKEVSFSQEKSDKDETVITIEWED